MSAFLQEDSRRQLSGSGDVAGAARSMINISDLDRSEHLVVVFAKLAVLAAAAVLAAIVPARRALRVDPMLALRQD